MSKLNRPTIFRTREGDTTGNTPYGRYRTENLILRDMLAIDRTVLANERTFLAYVRTSLALLIGGVGMIGLFMDNIPLLGAGILFASGSIVVFIYGLTRFVKKKDHIDRLIE